VERAFDALEHGFDAAPERPAPEHRALTCDGAVAVRFS
jgi:hypothetical protein